MNKTISFIKKNGVNLLSLVIILFSVTFGVFFRTNSVSGSSMEPNYSSGDIVITKKNTKDINIGDVITLNGREMTLATGQETPSMIKRVVAAPGDKVVIQNNILYVNDIEIDEPYIVEDMHSVADAEYKLDNDEFFVLGDNRNYSTDSRDYGPVKINWIDGTAVYTLYKSK